MFERFVKLLVFIVIKCLEKTYRMKIYDGQGRLLPKANSRDYEVHPCLVACWHEHLLSVLFTLQKKEFFTLASQSQAGRLIGNQCERYGFSVLYGSQDREGKDKGGLRAVIALRKALGKGASIILTVDGSVGPRRIVKTGIIDLARHAEVPIVPLAYAANKQWVLKTWDQFKLPKPFATIVMKYGQAITVPSDLKKEDMALWQEKIAAAIDAEEKGALDLCPMRTVKAF